MTNKKLLKYDLINCFTQNGNKYKSELILLKTFKLRQKDKKKQTKNIIKLSIINSSPFFSLKAIKKQKKTSIQFPFLLKLRNRVGYGIKSFAKSRISRLGIVEDILNSSNKIGPTFLKKQDLYKTSFNIKKLAHYRWFF